MIRILTGDCRDVLRTLPDASVQCCVTSPPYYGLRDYGTAQWEGGDSACDHTGIRRNHGDEKQATSAGTSRDPVSRECRKCGARRIDQQIGLEQSPDEYVATLVEVFREVRRVLRDDGTLWLNLGDSYAGGNQGGSWNPDKKLPGGLSSWQNRAQRTNGFDSGLAPKQLLMMPARMALALQADGWYLRSDIIWKKPNPMPESVTDRPTSAHEHVFLLAKAPRYFYDADAVREVAEDRPLSSWSERRITEPSRRGDPGSSGHVTTTATLASAPGRNMRNVWIIATAPFPSAHFATFPPELAERCIKAGTRPGDMVLDPFGGAGTVGLVADRLGRNATLIELNPAYVAMARERITNDAPLFAAVAD